MKMDERQLPLYNGPVAEVSPTPPKQQVEVLSDVVPKVKRVEQL